MLWGWWGLSLAVAPRTSGFGVREGEAGLGHPSCISQVLIGVEARQVAEGKEGFTLQVIGPQHVVVQHGQEQAGTLLPALLGGDQAAGRWDAGTITSQNLTFPPGTKQVPTDFPTVMPPLLPCTGLNPFKVQGPCTAPHYPVGPRC